MKKLFIIVFVLAFTGCGNLMPKDQPSVATYDFGLPRQNIDNVRPIKARLLVPTVISPSWLDTPAILYRLTYQDTALVQPYANSRWAASPSGLLTLRLRQAIADIKSGGAELKQYDVQVALEEFSQVFDQPDSSRVLLRANVQLVSHDDRNTVAEHIFAIERKAPTPDAQGAVSALTQASDEFITQLVAWVAGLPGV